MSMVRSVNKYGVPGCGGTGCLLLGWQQHHGAIHEFMEKFEIEFQKRLNAKSVSRTDERD